MKKTAILVDTASDLNPRICEEYGIYLLPAYVIFKDKTFRDMLDITPEELYKRLEVEMPKTSTASIGDIEELYTKIKNDGYENLVVVNISCELSSLHNCCKMAAEDFEGLNIEVIDSKNIAIATGFLGIYAAQLANSGVEFEEIVSKVRGKLADTKDFFTVATLKNLIEGGRIGKVSGTIGNLLNIKPIISCDPEGVYYTVDKVRGRNRSLSKIADYVREYLGDSKDYYIAICHGAAPKEAEDMKKKLADLIENASVVVESEISASLGVHTGAGLVGVGIFKAD